MQSMQSLPASSSTQSRPQRANKWVALTALCLVVLLVVMDNTIVNVDVYAILVLQYILG